MHNISIFTASQTKLAFSEPKTWFHAIADNKVIGHISVTPNPDFDWLSDLAVDEEFRGQGLGTSLIKAAIEFSKASGRIGVCAGVKKGNEGIFKLTDALGFKHCYTYPDSGNLMLSLRFYS